MYWVGNNVEVSFDFGKSRFARNFNMLDNWTLSIQRDSPATGSRQGGTYRLVDAVSDRLAGERRHGLFSCSRTA